MEKCINSCCQQFRYIKDEKLKHCECESWRCVRIFYIINIMVMKRSVTSWIIAVLYTELTQMYKFQILCRRVPLLLHCIYFDQFNNILIHLISEHNIYFCSFMCEPPHHGCHTLTLPPSVSSYCPLPQKPSTSQVHSFPAVPTQPHKSVFRGVRKIFQPPPNLKSKSINNNNY